jgi:indolepyruvate ferredoxin oxidoreductase alpha subunit
MANSNASSILLLSGDEAVSTGAWEAGVKVAAAYPGTPSTEILETLSQREEVDAQWSVNEKVAYEVAYGAAVGGVRSLYASKHVGLNVAMDPLMTSIYTGIGAGFVAVVCDDPGLASSQNEQDTRWVSIYAKMPLIEPAGPAEAYLYIKEAFAISEQFDTPVLFRMTTRVAHTKENVTVGSRVEVPAKELAPDIPKYVMVPKNAYQRHILLEKKLVTMQAFSSKTNLNRIEMAGTKLGIITSGVSYLHLKEEFPDASFLKLGFSFPFCDEKIKSFAASVQEIVVVEELDPFIEEHVKSLGIRCRAKHPTWRIGELRPEYMADVLAGKEKIEQPVTSRKPVLCPGCPHRFVFTILRRARAYVTGDIGCYTLGASPPLSSLHTCLCMGSGITIHEGIRRAWPDKKVVGVLGDSTFVHSGITGLINAVYNRAKGLIIILDNGTTAMTGGQNHPATGKTISDDPTSKLVLEDLCRACGVDHVDVVDPVNIKETEQLIKTRISEDALSVIIARRPCKLIDTERHTPPDVDVEKCKTCGLCFAIDCPAMKKDEKGRAVIDTSMCAGCLLCTGVCAQGALKKHE